MKTTTPSAGAGLRDAVLRFVTEHAPALRSARLVLAASGGADSTAMVSLLAEAGIAAPGRAVIAYFDHRLRGSEAGERERAAVRALASRYGLDLEVGEWSDPRPAEAAAREARYAFLREIAARYRAEAVMTGHTQDDQAETIVLHALRGAGLHGLAGIAPVTPSPGGDGLLLVRPILEVAREQTRGHCRALALDFVDDESNDDTKFLRNRVRSELMPAMDRDALLALGASARRRAAVLETEAASVLTGVQSGDPPQVILSREALAALSPQALPHAFRLALVRLLGDVREFDRQHYEALVRSASARTGAVLQLPRGVRATVDARDLVLSLGAALPAPIPPDVELAPPFEGTLGAWYVSLVSDHGTLLGKSETRLRVPQAAALRARRPGDRIRPRGLGGHKKLQDYYVDRKIPRRERDAAPVLARGNDVLWTPFGPVEEHPEGTRMHLAWHRIEPTNPVRNRCRIP